jgi:hypothetical protein
MSLLGTGIYFFSEIGIYGYKKFQNFRLPSDLKELFRKNITNKRLYRKSFFLKESA